VGLLSVLNWKRNKELFRWKVTAAYFVFNFDYGNEDYEYEKDLRKSYLIYKNYLKDEYDIPIIF
jgi:hypothetical protein